MDYVGIFGILAGTPLWITIALLYLFTDIAIYLMRTILEGLGYQIALSAKIGDFGLLTVAAIAITILQSGHAYIPHWAQNVDTQVGFFLLFVVIGAVVSVATIGIRSGRLADVYHDVVIAPAILFLMVWLVPVIWYNASLFEFTVALLAGVTWVLLIIFDVKQGRMPQREWMANRGIVLKG